MNSRPAVLSWLAISMTCGVVAVTIQTGWSQGKSTKPGKAPASAAGSPPTTVEAAKKVIDLRTLPLYAGAKQPDPADRKWYRVSYDANASVKDVYHFHRKQLLERKWTEIDAELETGEFRRDGYLLELLVLRIQPTMPTSVQIVNRGNVDPHKLPLPPGTKPFLDNSINATYHITAPVPAATKAATKALTDKGWQPYGESSIAITFKQNAMKVGVMVSGPDEPGGPTTIAYWPVLMAVDLPPMADAMKLDYDERRDTLKFNTKAKPEAIADFYTKALTKAGWTANKKTLTKVGDADTLIFKSKDAETLTLQVTSNEGQQHAELKYESVK